MPKGKFVANAEIKINAPVSRVWGYLTRPELIKQYFFGTEVKTDWKVGSTITYRGEWEGKSYKDKGVILQVVPQKLLVSTYWSSMSGVPDLPENYKTVKYELSEKKGVTALAITQDNNDTKEQAAHSEGNWKMVISKLKELAEKK